MSCSVMCHSALLTVSGPDQSHKTLDISSNTYIEQIREQREQKGHGGHGGGLRELEDGDGHYSCWSDSHNNGDEKLKTSTTQSSAFVHY